jgi:hypothetical protein
MMGDPRVGSVLTVAAPRSCFLVSMDGPWYCGVAEVISDESPALQEGSSSFFFAKEEGSSS